MVDTEGAHNSWHQAIPGTKRENQEQGERRAVDTGGAHDSCHQAGEPGGAEEQEEVVIEVGAVVRVLVEVE